jgi:hypothetical protein
MHESREGRWLEGSDLLCSLASSQAPSIRSLVTHNLGNNLTSVVVRNKGHMKKATSHLVSLIYLNTSSLSSISANSPSKENPTFSSSFLYFFISIWNCVIYFVPTQRCLPIFFPP